MASTSKTTTRSKTITTQKPPKAVAPTRKTRASAKPDEINPEHRQAMIAKAAYLRAEQRGFAGDPVEDWLAAEREVDLLLAEHATSVAQ